MGVRTGRGVVVAGVIHALVSVTLATAAHAGPTWFVVAERPGVEEHHDSYVLPLTDAADVAHARDLIAGGPDAAGAPIVFANVVAGADGVNRNALAPEEPLWNWHVAEFESFGDVGLELVDGWPTYVDGDVQGWIENTRRTPDENVGHIGFWNYTVVAELGGTPVTAPLPAGIGTGAMGLLAVVIAHLRPWALLRRRR